MMEYWLLLQIGFGLNPGSITFQLCGLVDQYILTEPHFLTQRNRAGNTTLSLL